MKSASGGSRSFNSKGSFKVTKRAGSKVEKRDRTGSKPKTHIKRHKLPSSLYNEEDEEEENKIQLSEGNGEEEELMRKREVSKVSFDVLSKVQNEYEDKYGSKSGNDSDEGPEEEGYNQSDSDEGPEESSSRPFEREQESETKSLRQIRQDRDLERQKLKRSHKHAPSESTFKRRVGVIRDIPGLEPIRKAKTEDIRFDTVFGPADLERARKNYEFLDEYRKDEISSLRNVLREAKRAEKMNKKREEEGNEQDEEEYDLPTMSERQKDNIKRKIQSLEGQLTTLKRRDFENEVVKKYQKEVKEGVRQGPKFLKRSDKRKLVLAEQYKTMKKKDVSKSLERKRKRNLAKERKTMPTERRG